jgi:transposase
MSRTGRPKVELTLSDADRVQLRRWAWWASQALALRARIVLACAELGVSNKDVAARVRCSQPTVGKWRSRFVRDGLDGLIDGDRPGRPSPVSVDRVAEVIVATLESRPGNATHWSRTSMAGRSGLSKSTIGRIWRDFGLKPHRADMFKLSTDPLFVEKVIDVVGLYHNPPERAVVLCVDEKSQMPGPVPAGAGDDAGDAGDAPERRSHDYVRNGITTLFAAFNIADGTVIGELHRHHRAVELKKFLITVDKIVLEGLDIHVVCDNLRHPQNPGDQSLAGQTPPHPPAFHPDRFLLAQPAWSGGSGSAPTR